MRTEKINPTDTYQEIISKIRKSSGIDLDKTSKRVSVSIWVRWLKDDVNIELVNLGHSLGWGCETGRFADYFPNERLFAYHKDHKLKFRTNLQMVKWFARAVVAQREFNTATTGSGYEALHQTRDK